MGDWADVGFSHSSLRRQILTKFPRYLKCLDRFYNNYVSCFITPGSTSDTVMNNAHH